MKVIIDSKERRSFTLNLIQNIRQDDCPIEVTIEPYVEKHSGEQQGLWHAMVREFAREVGYTEPEMKEILKQLILGTVIKEFNGRQVEVTKSSQYDENGKLTNKELYSTLIEETYRIAGEMGIQL